MRNKRKDSEYLGTELGKAEIPVSDSKIFMVRRVSLNGLEYFDVRKWVKWATDGQFHPTKSGVFIGIDVFLKGIHPAILELAGHNTSHNINASPSESQLIDNQMDTNKEAKEPIE